MATKKTTKKTDEAVEKPQGEDTKVDAKVPMSVIQEICDTFGGMHGPQIMHALRHWVRKHSHA